MPPKAKIAAPIDRPLSRAYLREFTGWSTAYSPGLSDSTSLRTMENCYVTRNGALAVRPGLRSVIDTSSLTSMWLLNRRLIGSIEPFFLNDGRRAYLAVHANPTSASFTVFVENATTFKLEQISLETAGFPSGSSTLSIMSSAVTYVRYVQIDNKIFAMPTSSNVGDSVLIFFVGAQKRVAKPQSQVRPDKVDADSLRVMLPAEPWIALNTSSAPTPRALTTDTLVSSNATANIYNFAFSYTIANELGESAPALLSTIKTQRAWSQWRLGPGDGAQPGGGADVFYTNGLPPDRARDLLSATVPEWVWDEVRSRGATRIYLYAATWSDQAPMPTELMRVAVKALTPSMTWGRDGTFRFTAAMPASEHTIPLPSADDVNYSTPSRATQALVAGDRIVLVGDQDNSARVRWSSNRQGEYTNFSASVGGGYKTLTSGNMQIPVSVKLWQNPQSVDTLTILCAGVDGYSTSYYMAPASVAGQSQSTQIMGFEETTATPGTVSPYGVEVVNQAMYHPLDDQLMKSTAANYNISHKTMTEDISNKWRALRNKKNIISSQLDNRIYYAVVNPDTGTTFLNEIWMLDVANPEPIWNRWLIPANALRRIELGGTLYMAVITSDGIFVLDDRQPHDDVRSGNNLVQRNISWKMETNVQGANRAHDAPARLEQVSLTFGSFAGRVKYGIRGVDLYGHPVDVSKIWKDERPVDYAARPMPWDVEDFLQVHRDMKEWTLYASSVASGGTTLPSYGQINLVQYRYAPASVNSNTALGTVESFEYRRASSLSPNVTTNYPNGIPAPVVDYQR